MSKHLVRLAVMLIAAMSVTSVLAADRDYPSRPIRLVVGYPPGGGIDFVARQVAQILGATLGQPVIVDNRPGANGIIGTDLVAKSQPDGYTLLLGDSSSLTINPAVYTSVPYRALQDFAPVSMLVSTSSILVVHPSLKVSTLQELIDITRKTPINFGSAGNGSISHLILEQIRSATGGSFIHVPYKGAQVFNAMLSGEIKVTVASQLGVKPFIDSGQLTALAVTSRQRSMIFPKLPTVSESGIPGFEAVNWFGVLAPKGTPPEIISRLNQEFVRVVHSPELRAKLVASGADVVGSSPGELAEAIQLDMKKWAKVAADSGAKIE
jgi:tripartite-type tricarboxylate transporter receptor subunit TctC